MSLASRSFALTLLCVSATWAAEPTTRATIAFNDNVRPIFTKHCVACHGGPKQAGGVTFASRDGALATGDSGERPIVPGDVDASYLLERVRDPDDATRMPPPEHGPRLTDDEVATLTQWIEQGATWQQHWSWTQPKTTEPPDATLTAWPRGRVDRFVLAKIEEEGLRPSPAASKAEWLRRVSFDLTGLPPTLAEQTAFLLDNRPDAYEQVVDRLLASPRYGERWASVWLDLARYADTMGYERDPHRDIWPYRDWLIRAFNKDMPYDEFTIKQLAGDLLPDASIDDQVATAFHRNTMTNVEGGTDDEEFRTAAVIDRVNTTWQVWMGATFGCAQCHDHPYDAFTTDDYYAFMALFNNTRDTDAVEDNPRLSVPKSRDEFALAESLDREIRALRQELCEATTALQNDEGQWRSLAIDRAESTGSTKLKLRTANDHVEVIAGGTITSRSRFTLEAPVTTPRTVTALRIEAMPYDLQSGARNPDVGFVLSKLKLERLTEGKSPESIPFAVVVDDDPHPHFDPADSLHDNPRGWAVYTRISAWRWAVFVMDEPVTLAAGDRFRLTLKQEKSLDGQGALVLRRSRYSLSDRPAWTELATSEGAIAQRDRLAEAIERRAAIASVSIPVMQERPPTLSRRTFVFDGGNWLEKRTETQPATPTSLPPAEIDNAERMTRLDMARWIASPDNPLTSRTVVNRIWSQLFGVGFVESEGDLGGAGTSASHPELLDDLSARFVTEHQWRLKSLLKELVLTATYRQQARVSEELALRDPRNRLLARGPRQRLTAEMVRDQALALSGRLSPKMFGPPVMPYQPDGIWQSVHSAARWETATGEDRYRRAVYTYWKRTSGYPSLVSFDAPSREVCTVRRIATNTPLQALVTLNDPAFVELAQVFAARIQRQGDDVGLKKRLRWACRVATGKPVPSKMIAELIKLHADARQHYDADPQACQSLGASADEYAMVIVANAILNLDATLTR